MALQLRDLDFTIEKAQLKDAYGTILGSFNNVQSLPINTNRDYYDTNLGILYIHKGEGRLPLELAKEPLLYLKQALLHASFINELDKALVGDKYNTRLFKKAVDEFIMISDYNFENNKIEHCDFKEVINKLIAKIS